MDLTIYQKIDVSVSNSATLPTCWRQRHTERMRPKLPENFHFFFCWEFLSRCESSRGSANVAGSETVRERERGGWFRASLPLEFSQEFRLALSEHAPWNIASKWRSHWFWSGFSWHYMKKLLELAMVRTLVNILKVQWWYNATYTVSGNRQNLAPQEGYHNLSLAGI